MLIVHFIGLSMGLGTTFAHAFLGIAASKMNAEEATKFRMQTLVLGKMGNIAIILLILSGLYLLIPYWSTLLSQPLLIIKLVLVIVLTTLIIMIHLYAEKALKGDEEAQLKKMEILGKSTLPLAIIIVILAVYIFH